MKREPITVAQAVFMAATCDRLFKRAANAWVRGNNSGQSGILAKCEKQCDRLRRDAEKLLEPLGIEVDYPGLYPSFTVNGFAEYSTINAISAALGGKAVAS